MRGLLTKIVREVWLGTLLFGLGLFAAEGLFDEAAKRPLPFLPDVIGVVTSPTGAVIRDILHRLADRFPRHVVIWPVLVQGKQAPVQVAAADRDGDVASDTEEDVQALAHLLGSDLRGGEIPAKPGEQLVEGHLVVGGSRCGDCCGDEQKRSEQGFRRRPHLPAR